MSLVAEDLFGCPDYKNLTMHDLKAILRASLIKLGQEYNNRLKGADNVIEFNPSHEQLEGLLLTLNTLL